MHRAYEAEDVGSRNLQVLIVGVGKDGKTSVGATHEHVHLAVRER